MVKCVESSVPSAADERVKSLAGPVRNEPLGKITVKSFPFSVDVGYGLRYPCYPLFDDGICIFG